MAVQSADISAHPSPCGSDVLHKALGSSIAPSSLPSPCKSRIHARRGDLNLPSLSLAKGHNSLEAAAAPPSTQSPVKSSLQARRANLKLSTLDVPTEHVCKYEGFVRGYDKLEAIGAGSTSIVHRAIRQSDGEQVVLKSMRRLGSDHVALAKQEYELVQSLNYPNIIKVFDFIENKDETSVIVLEYFQGKNLSQVMKSMPGHQLPPGVALRLFIQLLSAVEYLHSHGIVHRDIKADNLLVSDDLQTIKLIDFNTSRNMEEALTPTGTPDYASPEVVRGESPSQAHDVWTAGLCLHVMLTGRLPGRGGPGEARRLKTEAAATIAHDSDGKPRIADLCRWALLQSLEADEDARITASELLKGLQQQRAKINEEILIALRSR
mmetsp:Transcript_59249/g.163878  ORF Transcript_59249/g.163878 Transcript_59249/m.163878 type:complete len:379 (+) Transcript_59249:49-1185(+)